MNRISRKLEHLQYAQVLGAGPCKSGFADITLLHNCIPDCSWEDIDLSMSLFSRKFPHPFIINAITGGSEDVKGCNKNLAEIAKATQSIIAVGSQYAAVKNARLNDTYGIVRETYPEGFIIANIGAYASPEEALQAVEMIQADALQIHLNVAQELIMEEGDRNFRNYYKRIQQITESVAVPVIVKEVGFGMAAEQVSLLAETGVAAIDVGGSGGTNFLNIESQRQHAELSYELQCWGIPTAISMVETVEMLGDKNIEVISSGGVYNGLDGYKSIVLGAKAFAVAGPIVKQLHQNGCVKTVEWVNSVLHELRLYMMLTGVTSLSQAKSVPLVITGYVAEWLRARGIDLQKYALRAR